MACNPDTVYPINSHPKTSASSQRSVGCLLELLATVHRYILLILAYRTEYCLGYPVFPLGRPTHYAISTPISSARQVQVSTSGHLLCSFCS
jgi:hypothetical protein